MNMFMQAALLLGIFLTAPAVSGGLFAQATAQAGQCDSYPPHLHANLWMQTSAEYQAICRQTFNVALKEVKQAVKSAKRRDGRPVGPDKKPLAVVADLDETILDNARFQSEMDAAVSLNCKDEGYSPKRWQRWEQENAEEVGLVPGAGAFIAEVEKLKVVIVYVSNRLESLKDSTIRALAHNGINTEGLQVSTQLRLLLKPEKSKSDKQDRIKQADQKFHVVAYLGDNLADFPEQTEQPKAAMDPLAVRRKNVESAASLWGTRWFVLPNPVYGRWDEVLPNTFPERMRLLRRAANRRFVEEKKEIKDH